MCVSQSCNLKRVLLWGRHRTIFGAKAGRLAPPFCPQGPALPNLGAAESWPEGWCECAGLLVARGILALTSLSPWGGLHPGWGTVTGQGFLVLQAGHWQWDSHKGSFWLELQTSVAGFLVPLHPNSTHSLIHPFILSVCLCWGSLPHVHPWTPDSLQIC